MELSGNCPKTFGLNCSDRPKEVYSPHALAVLANLSSSDSQLWCSSLICFPNSVFTLVSSGSVFKASTNSFANAVVYQAINNILVHKLWAEKTILGIRKKMLMESP